MRALNVFHFSLRLNLEKQVEQFQYWADSFEMLPMYFMCFYGAQNINTVIDVSGTAHTDCCSKSITVLRLNLI